MKRAAQRAQGFSRALELTRAVTSSTAPGQSAAAASAAPAAKATHMQAFQVYRWNPDDGGKPMYQTYNVSRGVRLQGRWVWLESRVAASRVNRESYILARV